MNRIAISSRDTGPQPTAGPAAAAHAPALTLTEPSTPMAELTLVNARLLDPEADRLTEGGLLIRDGRIAEIFADRRPGEDCGGRVLAPGIIDIGVKVGEPGERHKESFRTAGAAAAAGGVTTIVTRPDTLPAVDSPEALEFLQRRAVDASPVNVLAMAALTKGREGREMTEIGFLIDAGAVGFTDARPVADARVFQRCLTYATGLGALVLGHPQEPRLSDGACMTSGQFASQLGLPAVSPMAERIGLERDLALVELTGARYHADQISTALSLPALRRARAAGLRVTAGASIHHLTLNEFDVGDYRTFFKLTPPLRSENDRMAMVEALAAGEIDVVGSFHTPQDEEEKRLPFEEAASGAVGLETLLPAAMQLHHGGHMTLPALWRTLALNPARLLGLDAGRLAPGAPADLVLFDPDTPFVLDRASLRSKSKNTPYDLRRMQGRVLGTWVGGRRVFAREPA
jgi:dihydroorotase